MDDADKPMVNVYRDGPFTRRRLDDVLAAHRPLVASLSTGMFRLDGRGFRPAGANIGTNVEADAEDGDPVVAILTADLPAAPRDFAPLTSFVRERADTWEAVFGQIGPRVESYKTTFEASLPHSPGWLRAVRQGREFLRGYNWVTVVPRELVERLGGIEKLRASGAFYSVEELAFGGAWLQVTKTLEEFDKDAVWRVFRAVAPVLRIGMPVDQTLPVPIPNSANGSSIPGRLDHWAVAIADAADYR